ncbi:hypothetical protein [Trichormus variabilis]|uniref:Uncharacterized protein n=1 Tax=Trichormus variabilis SAG 1403-4b TaxID=447716 RepID=A0A3S1A2D5_ANAVA|nr:hypothetical protein [Trichormus variabilis]MBD2629890.1 hypothetical protein [Trichormus variabilis FACHB-164]RUS92535.1 hypothetical protein DSM107003_50180 [Trichormus variabilis SAG 1403-4b]
MVQFERMWAKIRRLEVFSLAELTEFCDFEVSIPILAAYILALKESGYLLELTGKRNLITHGRYRLVRDLGQFAPILRDSVSMQVMGQFVQINYAMYDPNEDFYFPLIKED